MRDINNFSLGGRSGASWVGGKNFMLKKSMCLFCPLEGAGDKELGMSPRSPGKTDILVGDPGILEGYHMPDA